MVNKNVLALFALLLVSPAVFPQGKAIVQKPVSTSRSEINSEYGRSNADVSRKHSDDFSNTITNINPGENSDYSNNKFTNSTVTSKNYFRIEDNDNSLWNGKHWENDDFPLKVYVKKSSSKYYKNKYKDYIDYAFKVWHNADERINFEYTSSSKSADIIVSFEDNLLEKYNENYLGLTDYDLGRNHKIDHSYIEISMLKFENKKLSDGEIKSTIIHEFGHALGLGHSKNHYDLMYPYINESSSSKLTYIELSTGDIEAVRSAIDLGNDNYSSK